MAKLIATLTFLALVSLGLHELPRPQAEAATVDRSRGLTFAPEVSPSDRAWILESVAKARPEAARLLDEIDGKVTIRAFHAPDSWYLGLAAPVGPDRYEVRVNVARLNGSRTIDRDTIVLHELAHVVDFALIDAGLRDRLAAQVPATGVCHRGLADCASAQERFADTFAKWALRGAVSITGAGYSIPAPASLEDWGAPLAKLAIELDVRSR